MATNAVTNAVSNPWDPIHLSIPIINPTHYSNSIHESHTDLLAVQDQHREGNDPWQSSEDNVTPLHLPSLGININHVRFAETPTKIQDAGKLEPDETIDPCDNVYEKISVMVINKIEVASNVKSVFKHLDYYIKSPKRASVVIRRYSDFVWLQDILLNRYPFRNIVSIPPKKVGKSERFIEKRRKGLSRFLNYIANHTILSRDDVVIDFIEHTGSFQVYKSDQGINRNEESMYLDLSDEQLQELPLDFDQDLLNFILELKSGIDNMHLLISILERFVQRLDESTADLLQISSIIPKIFRQSIFIDPQDLANSDLKVCELSNNTESMSINTTKKSQSISNSLIESLKSYRDLLLGFQALVSRKDSQIVLLSPEMLLKRISANKNRLVELTIKGVHKDIEKVNHLIIDDQNEAEYQAERLAYVRYFIMKEIEEFKLFKRQLFIGSGNFLAEVVESSIESLQVCAID